MTHHRYDRFQGAEPEPEEEDAVDAEWVRKFFYEVPETTDAEVEQAVYIINKYCRIVNELEKERKLDYSEAERANQSRTEPAIRIFR